MFYSGMMGAMGGGLGNAGALLGGTAGQDVAGLFKKRMQEGQAAAPMPGMGATPGAFLGNQIGNVAGISFDINESAKNRKMRGMRKLSETGVGGEKDAAIEMIKKMGGPQLPIAMGGGVFPIGNMGGMIGGMIGRGVVN